MGLDEVLSDLEREAYATRPFIVPACATDAPHRRDRVWIIARNVAHADSEPKGEQVRGSYSKQINSAAAREWATARDGFTDRRQDVADTKSLQRNGSGKHTQQSERQEPQPGDSRSSDDVAHAASKRQQGSRLHGRSQHSAQNKDRQADRADNGGQRNAQFWLPEPAVGRVANGIPRRVDRLRGLGNAIVPQIAMRIGQTIKAVADQ